MLSWICLLYTSYLKLNFQGKKIIIKSNFNDVFIQISKIFYIESISRQRNIVLSTGQAVPTYEPLQKLYAKLNSDRFQFTHKCYVVQLSKVDRIEQNFAVSYTHLDVYKRQADHACECDL